MHAKEDLLPNEFRKGRRELVKRRLTHRIHKQEWGTDATSLAPDPLLDRYAGKGSGQLTIPISFCKLHVARGC